MKLQLITALALATLVAAPASAGPLKDAWIRQQTSITDGLADGFRVTSELMRRRRTSIIGICRPTRHQAWHCNTHW